MRRCYISRTQEIYLHVIFILWFSQKIFNVNLAIDIVKTVIYCDDAKPIIIMQREIQFFKNKIMGWILSTIWLIFQTSSLFTG